MNIGNIKPTASVALADRVREMEATGKTIIKLQTGDPDCPTHPAVIDAAYKALQSGNTHYSSSPGLPVLRTKIAQVLSDEAGYTITMDQVLVTHGAAEGIMSVMAGLLEYGNEVLILEPAWPTVASLARLMGAVPIGINALETENVVPQLIHALSSKTRMVCVNSPNNPTGRVLPPEFFAWLVNWCKEHNLYLVSDEVYRFLVYDGEAGSVLPHLADYDKAVFVDSFSKKFAMTGWRIGYLVAAAVTFKQILKASQLTITHVAPFVQLAALAALENALVAEASFDMKKKFSERRTAAISACQRLGLRYLDSGGAFYFFISTGRIDDINFAERLLEEYGVCVVPGSAYGEAGKGYVRITYAVNIKDVLEGLRCIAELLKRKGA